MIKISVKIQSDKYLEEGVVNKKLYIQVLVQHTAGSR
jgi:hypothetical protein